MVTLNIVLVEIIIQGKAEFGHRTIGSEAFQPSTSDTVFGEAVYPDLWIFLNIPYVVKDERAIEGVWIYQQNKKGWEEKQQKISQVD